jgi:hypothetical protein
MLSTAMATPAPQTPMPYDHPLNHIMQDVFNYASYFLTVVLLIVAFRMSAKQRTPFYVLLLLAVFVGALGEPIYDITMMLLFYIPGIVTHFTSFSIPQPIWTHSGYAILYAFPAMFICSQIHKGTMTAGKLYIWAGFEFLLSCVFEMIGINGGTYAYWGPHVFRVFSYPLVIGILEAAQTISFAVVAANLRTKVKTNFGLMGLFVLFPITMIGVNQGLGSIMIVTLHMPNPTHMMVLVSTCISILYALVAIRGAALFIPAGSAKLAPKAKVVTHRNQSAVV